MVEQRPAQIGSQEGFTLVEVLVATMLMIMVLMALYALFDMSIRVYGIGNTKVEVNQNTRIAIDKMEREIRSAWTPQIAGCASSKKTDLISSTSTASTISFKNCLASVTDAPTDISYSVSNGDLMRNGNKLARLGIPATGQALSFQYCTLGNVSAANCPSTPPSNTVLVRIELKVTKDGRTQQINSFAGLRNARNES